MHKPHSERPKMPGLPRHRPDPRPAVSNAGAMPRTVPILPAMPIPQTPGEMRPSMRLSWSKSIVDRAQRGEAVHQEPDFRPSDVRPVRSQAAARARAGEIYHLLTPIPEPEISVNFAPATPGAPELVTGVNTPEVPRVPFEAPDTAWSRIRKVFGALFGVFRHDCPPRLTPANDAPRLGKSGRYCPPTDRLS